MSDEITDSPSKWTFEQAVGVFTLIVFLSLLVVAICEATHTDDDADADDPSYRDTSIDDLYKYGGIIYFGDSDSIYVPKNNYAYDRVIQVKDGIILVSYKTLVSEYSSGGHYPSYKYHKAYGSIDQITSISIYTHE